ncbi:MAG: glycine/sarcosine/betaine reductase selenoprotein B family protein [Acidimicrobiia bacterium]|nr:glycine/sarcosine/betaine reductase selenoprotein B family protein [Acidimicrobiia bacterium]
MSDTPMRDYAAGMPMPDLGPTPGTDAKPLAESRVAIVTPAAMHVVGDEGFTNDDTSFRVIDRERRDLTLGHWSPNFDRAGFAADLDVVYPIDRLEELAADGVIGSVAPRHLAFAGNQEDTLTAIRLDSGPRAAALLLADAVDVVLLTPV